MRLGLSVHVCGHRKRRVLTLEEPWLLNVRVGHCPDSGCPGHLGTVSPREEMAIAPPRLQVAWDVFAWIGHRRFARHWSVPQVCAELYDSRAITVSEDANRRNDGHRGAAVVAAGNLGGNGSGAVGLRFTQTHHSTNGTKTRRVVGCERHTRAAKIGHHAQPPTMRSMVGLLGGAPQSAAPSSAGYPTARHTGAAWVASGSPAANSTCNWWAASGAPCAAWSAAA